MSDLIGNHIVGFPARRLIYSHLPNRNLGDKTSFIELDTPKMSTIQMWDLEAALNEKIRESIAVTPVLYHDKNDPELLKVSFTQHS